MNWTYAIDKITQLFANCKVGLSTSVRNVLEQGFNLTHEIKSKYVSLAELNPQQPGGEYLNYFKPPIENNFTFSPDNFVIVRVWLPSHYGKPVSYTEAILRRTFTPNNTHAHVGHLSMYIRNGEREQYVSLFPTESHFFTTSSTTNNTLIEDLEAQEKLPPSSQVLLFSLDTKKMLETFDHIQPRIRWFLSGNRFVLNMTHDEVYNCSSYVEKLLTEGGIYNHLLPPNQKLFDPMSPKGVCELAQRAAEVERILYPETEEILKKHIQTFSNEVLKKSKDGQNPFTALNTYLQENPDFYLRVYAYNADLLASVLPEVYRNIQCYHNERLLQAAQSCHSNPDATWLEELDKLLYMGANLAARDENGYNALHLMIKNNCYSGVEKLLEKFPQATNTEILYNHTDTTNEEGVKSLTPLDLAFEQGNFAIIRLIMKCGGMTKQCPDISFDKIKCISQDEDDHVSNHFVSRFFQDKSAAKRSSIRNDNIVSNGNDNNLNSSTSLLQNNSEQELVNCDSNTKKGLLQLV